MPVTSHLWMVMLSFTGETSSASGFGTLSITNLLLVFICLCLFAVMGLLYSIESNQRGQADPSLDALRSEIKDLAEQVQQIAKTSQEHSQSLTLAQRPASATPAPPPKPTPAAAPTAEITQEVEPKAAPAKQEPVTQASESNGSNLEQAIDLIKHMEDDHPANLLKAKDILMGEINGPNKADAYTYLAEIYFWLGDISTSDTEKETYHKEGVDFGKEAVQLAPNSVTANLWYASNMGSHGVARGIMSSLFYIPDIHKYGEKAMNLDPNFFHGAALRLMGRFYHECPGWPVGKGDINKAVQILEKAVKAGPDFLVNHLYLAEVYMAKRKKKEAKAVLEDIVSRGPMPVMPKYQAKIQDKARSLLKKV